MLADEISRLALTRHELHQIEILINARSFDFDHEFTELCQLVCGRADATPSVTFFSNF